MAEMLTSTTPSTICDEDIDAKFAEIIAAEWPKLEGRQTPNSLAYTPGDVELGRKAVELARRSASRIRAMPWQSWSLERIMSKDPDGTWTHPECCLIVPRQNGKSLILSLRVLYGLFKLGEKIVFSAQQWETAKSLWKRTWNIVKTTPWMLKRVESKTCSQGRGTIVLASGAEVVFTTRSANAGRGLDKVDLEIYDEAYDLTEADMAALSPTKMNSDDPQTIYTSSAVNQDQHSNGAVLSAVRDRGLDGEEGLFFAEWMAPEDQDRSEPDTWRWANPSFGVIQTVKKLAAELRKFSTDAGKKSFDVEYLGRGDWPTAVTDEAPPVVNLAEWSARYSGEPSLTGMTCLAVDMSTEREVRDRTCSIVVAAKTTQGAHLQIGYHGSADTTAVVKFLAAAVEAGDPVAVVIDPKSTAQVLIQPLQKAGVEPELMRAQDVMTSTAGFLAAVDEKRITHDDDPRMLEALSAAKLREIGDAGGVAWARKTSGTICQLVAASNALWGLSQFEPKAVPPPPAVGFEPTPAGRSVMGDLMEVSW
ncbi:terminase large subunit [Prescottella equi]|uniref:terminase large subunit n=1 Tax=Rhodococcus hoagii TaxID=43767 RepID=UPI0019E701D7|nr:terminase large subunit [Prescottella equi]MBM4577747.1 hypothetical protein [Prescottella equi]MBM4577758.1 hypothetical protein [Prescottella equi]MBM4577763.1 hypothetical protein [Prescottella equi]MBM4580913.1 hypothetical protein [Prescottella equi]MBM4580975.1 hypothetical protein [Prescottella equi]